MIVFAHSHRPDKESGGMDSVCRPYVWHLCSTEESKLQEDSVGKANQFFKKSKVSWSVLLSACVYLGNPKCSDVLAVGGSAIPSSPQCSQDAANALYGNASVDGVSGWRRGARQTSASVIVTNGFHRRGQDACHHTQYRGQTYCG